MLDNFENNFNLSQDVTKKRLLLQTIIKEIKWNGETLEVDLTLFHDDKKK